MSSPVPCPGDSYRARGARLHPWSQPGLSPVRRGAAMAATCAVGLKGRGRSTSSMQGRKAKLSQHAQELRTIISSQGAAPWASWGQPGAGGGLLVPPSSCVIPTAPSCPPEQERKAFTWSCEEELCNPSTPHGFGLFTSWRGRSMWKTKCL